MRLLVFEPRTDPETRRDETREMNEIKKVLTSLCVLKHYGTRVQFKVCVVMVWVRLVSQQCAIARWNGGQTRSICWKGMTGVQWECVFETCAC